MQRAGDVGRRNDDAIRLGLGALRPLGAAGGTSSVVAEAAFE